jgi:hypothetical protein
MSFARSTKEKSCFVAGETGDYPGRSCAKTFKETHRSAA